MKTRDFVYAGESFPDLNTPEYTACLFHFEKSILLSLENQTLLTHAQTKQCLLKLEKEFSQK